MQHYCLQLQILWRNYADLLCNIINLRKKAQLTEVVFWVWRRRRIGWKKWKREDELSCDWEEEEQWNAYLLFSSQPLSYFLTDVTHPWTKLGNWSKQQLEQIWTPIVHGLTGIQILSCQSFPTVCSVLIITVRSLLLFLSPYHFSFNLSY
jgi:hypothetical protein